MDQSREAENETTEVEEEQELDLRGELEAAIGGDESEAEATDGDRASDAVPEPKQGDDKDQADAAGGDGAGEKPVAEAKGEVGAPVDWDATLRESWKDLPAPVKAKIAERERHIAQTMQGTAQARRIADTFSQVASQYGSVMAAEGVQNPIQMFDNVMKTVSELRMGTTQQRASRLADLVQTYGVDIKALDDALTQRLGGQPEGQPGGNPDLEAMIDQRMAPVNSMMQQLAAMQQQKMQVGAQEAAHTVQEFASKPEGEFLNDVRHDMADLIDLATRQGREMSLQEAYNKACAMNPQISQVLEQRAQQQRLAEAGQGVAQKRAAASSIKPRSLAGGREGSSDNLTDALNAAWDEQIGR